MAPVLSSLISRVLVHGRVEKSPPADKYQKVCSDSRQVLWIADAEKVLFHYCVFCLDYSLRRRQHMRGCRVLRQYIHQHDLLHGHLSTTLGNRSWFDYDRLPDGTPLSGLNATVAELRDWLIRCVTLPVTNACAKHISTQAVDDYADAYQSVLSHSEAQQHFSSIFEKMLLTLAPASVQPLTHAVDLPSCRRHKLKPLELEAFK